jgi:hypothetical protein
MEAASRAAFEPLTEAGPEMPSAPGAHGERPGVLVPEPGPGPSEAGSGGTRASSRGPAPDAALAQELLGAPGTGVAPGASASASAAATPTPAPAMDRDFIARNQIVERYISGRLPIKGATDFERFCRENPQLLDELGLPERVNAGLRLLEASGKPEPWQEAPRKFWEKPQLVLALGGAMLVLVITLAIVASGSSGKSRRIAQLQARVAEQPLEPATQTRTIRLLPSYKGGSNTPAFVIGGAATQLADLKIDMSRSAYRNFRVTIDRIDQGRVAVLHNLAKDSNGHLRVELNSSALGPGNYQLTIEGLTWKGEAVPDAWITIGIQH